MTREYQNVNKCKAYHREIASLALLIACVSLSACNKAEEDEDIKDPKVLYNSAVEALNDKKYELAGNKFERIEREFPITDYAADAQIKRAYALYKDMKPYDAIAVIEDFVKQYPAHSGAAYMYYLKGMCYYDQIMDVGRDQKLTQDAIDAFDELINRFPASNYTKDAKLKREYAYNTLAGKEMDIGRFYLQSNNFLAALGRFQSVVEDYQNSIFIEEALFRLVEIYYAIGDKKQSQTYAAVLGYNYPHSKWYSKAYEILHASQEAKQKMQSKLEKEQKQKLKDKR